MKILFLLKKNATSGDPGSGSDVEATNTGKSSKAGLFNSATFVAEALEDFLGIKTVVDICFDGNEINKKIFLNRPDICILEALWVTPAKIQELQVLYPKLIFVIRIHSNIPFLANEGMAITWIKEYTKIKNVVVSCNNLSPKREFDSIGIPTTYLPNIYIPEGCSETTGLFSRILKYYVSKFLCTGLYKPNIEVIDIGCFGAIRPMKNQLTQAIAAMGYADQTGLKLRFHINASRVEQKGESALKNIRALFTGTNHELVEYGWLSHDDFLKVIKTMDLGMQLSLSESFNIVTADFVSQGVPIIVSPEIKWMPRMTKVNPYNSHKIIQKISDAVQFGQLFADISTNKLISYNIDALSIWEKFLFNCKK